MRTLGSLVYQEVGYIGARGRVQTCLGTFRRVWRRVWAYMNVFRDVLKLFLSYLFYYLLYTYSGRVLRIRGGMWWGHVIRRHVITLGLYKYGFQVLGTVGSFNSK